MATVTVSFTLDADLAAKVIEFADALIEQRTRESHLRAVAQSGVEDMRVREEIRALRRDLRNLDRAA